MRNALFDEEAFRRGLEDDAELALGAKFLDGAIRVRFGERAMLVGFRDGKLAELREASPFDSSFLDVSAPESEWREFLKPVPPPFYHHIFPAVLCHRFDWSGDLEKAFAYMPALNRMFDILRAAANGRTGQ